VLDAGEYAGRLSFRFSPDQPPITSRSKFVVPKAAAPTAAGK